jgi:hypothetical protein
VAAGRYTAKNTGTFILIANESAGRWVSPSPVKLPPDAATGRFANAESFTADCTKSGYCAVGGAYDDKSGGGHAIVAAFAKH